MVDLPLPPVPADTDLRDFGFMPLDVRRLLTSETWIEGADSPKAAHAAMCLWCESWHQVPASSVPDNDKVLARLAMCTTEEWAGVRTQALRGFQKCSDGRLYHLIVAEKAREAWGQKRGRPDHSAARSEHARKAARARWGKPPPMLNDAQADAQMDAQPMLDGCSTDAQPMLDDSRASNEHHAHIVKNQPLNAQNNARALPKNAMRETGRETETERGEDTMLPQDAPAPATPRSGRGTRWTDDKVPPSWIADGATQRQQHNLEPIDLNLEAELFVNFWHAKSGKDATKVDWNRTWVNWCLKSRAKPPNGHAQRNGAAEVVVQTPGAELHQWRLRVKSQLDRGRWDAAYYGPVTGDRAKLPDAIYREHKAALDALPGAMGHDSP